MNGLVLKLSEIFGSDFIIIGVVHLAPLPGSPFHHDDIETIIERALRDARAYEEGGVDGIIVENYNDSPFRIRVTQPETIAAMSVIVDQVVKEVSIPVGISFLRNSAVEALAIAHVTRAKFIRVNAFIETVVTDSGIAEAIAPELLRYAKKLSARVGILADLHVKHGKPIVYRPLRELVVEAFERGKATAVIITGSKTGEAPIEKDLIEAKSVGKGPVLVGSGISPKTLDLLKKADGAIVGTYFKKDGKISNPVDVERVKKLVSLIKT